MNPVVIGAAIFRELGKLWLKEDEKKKKDQQAILLYAKYLGKSGPNQLIRNHVYKIYMVFEPKGAVSIRLANRNSYLEYESINHLSSLWIIMAQDNVSKAFCNDFKVPYI